MARLLQAKVDLLKAQSRNVARIRNNYAAELELHTRMAEILESVAESEEDGGQRGYKLYDLPWKRITIDSVTTIYRRLF